MRVLTTLFMVIFGFGGLLMLVFGVVYPGGFNTANASAPQIAQVYSQATYYIAIAVALLILSGLFAMSYYNAGHIDRHNEVIAGAEQTDSGYECPNCGAEIYMGQRFCAQCAQRLSWDIPEG